MASNSEKQTKQLCVIVERQLSTLVAAANEAGVTEEEYKEITPIPEGFVLVYFR